MVAFLHATDAAVCPSPPNPGATTQLAARDPHSCNALISATPRKAGSRPECICRGRPGAAVTHEPRPGSQTMAAECSCYVRWKRSVPVSQTPARRRKPPRAIRTRATR
ncbi:hypothetical protein Xcc3_41420 [Xanthomonas campestris pv. campestris]|nr:hypothetical protein Xcc3_41420 [Xanthomonas campestris pv. campestris]